MAAIIPVISARELITRLLSFPSGNGSTFMPPECCAKCVGDFKQLTGWEFTITYLYLNQSHPIAQENPITFSSNDLKSYCWFWVFDIALKVGVRKIRQSSWSYQYLSIPDTFMSAYRLITSVFPHCNITDNTNMKHTGLFIPRNVEMVQVVFGR